MGNLASLLSQPQSFPKVTVEVDYNIDILKKQFDPANEMFTIVDLPHEVEKERPMRLLS